MTALAVEGTEPTVGPDTLLECADLSDAADGRVDDLSKGTRMRLNLAGPLINRPELLFLDEPTSGQDPVGPTLPRGLVREAVDAGCTVFLATHDMAPHGAGMWTDAGRVAAS